MSGHVLVGGALGVERASARDLANHLHWQHQISGRSNSFSFCTRFKLRGAGSNTNMLSKKSYLG